MNLILVRHAEAAAQTLSIADGERPLTAAGEKASARAGRLIAGLNLSEPRIVCSPKLRARQTAAILASTIGVGAPQELACLLGGLDPDLILSGLERPADSGTLIAVGHEPDMGRLLARLIDPAWGGTIPFPTTGLAWIEIGAFPPPRAGRLRLFADPRCLATSRASSSPASS